VKADELVIGTVGRIDPMKDQLTFLRAGAILRETLPVRFACVGMGSGDAAYEKRIRQTAHSLGLEDAMLWVSVHNNLTAVYNALDVLCSSSSYGEGFPNVVGEAMACGVPCVVTDVGDSANIVGDGGFVVPPNQPPALAEALRRLLLSGRAHARDAARQRIEKEFSVDILTTRTSLVLQRCVKQGSSAVMTFSVRP
jgi:glycosyltransferase involved in cell wall biosynthesis